MQLKYDGHAACACVLKFKGGIGVVHYWACDTGAMRALMSGLMRHTFNPCLVAAAGIPSLD